MQQRNKSILSPKYKQLLVEKELSLESLALTSDLCVTCKAVSSMAHQVLNYWYGSNLIVQIPGGLAITIGTGADSPSPVSSPSLTFQLPHPTDMVNACAWVKSLQS